MELNSSAVRFANKGGKGGKGDDDNNDDDDDVPSAYGRASNNCPTSVKVNAPNACCCGGGSGGGSGGGGGGCGRVFRTLTSVAGKEEATEGCCLSPALK